MPEQKPSSPPGNMPITPMETNLIGGTIRDLLKEGSRNSQEGAAIYLGAGKQLNHRELEHLLTVAEQDLRNLGIGRNTRVMTALPDGPLTACVLLALTRSAICAPVNPDLRRAELESLIPELAAEVLVAHGPCAAEARASAAAAGLPIVEVEFHELTLQWTGDKLENAAIANAPESPDDLALILLTSGSSARPIPSSANGSGAPASSWPTPPPRCARSTWASCSPASCPAT